MTASLSMAVGDGVEIGHGADCGIAAARRCHGPGPDGFLSRETRLAEMYVYVGESRDDGLACEVDDLNSFRDGQFRTDGLYPAVPDKYVPGFPVRSRDYFPAS